MKPVKTSHTNMMLGAPKDWDEFRHGPCIGLPVVATEDPYFYSYWSLTWRERLAILFGCPVRLCIASASHPPVMLDASHH